ncbi:siderophore-interacting protein [Demequina sp. TTPB684]|uniref:siderophore-interacting protein n=1 Tax=unclassified Demequina TaxID=2620311 RepID=UPI001CF10724|nr:MULTISPECIES: siderophore-interacting protein [unclassified Demequina]MCB2412301.1 siderophore-interacting protein [Demequina sp. TTPB684]UPU87581.1 siderophore-interacting protein [Demequina sp. TMPB413]
MTTPTRPPRPVHTATVSRTKVNATDMVRVILTGEGLRALPELTFTDHYVKLMFGDVTRTYTVRWFDRVANEMAIDFVIHGDEGLAGPWAARAQPGDEISFMGPGGAWAPAPDADAHLLVGDEAAIPAIAAALDALPADARAWVFLEVASAAHHQPLRVPSRTTVTWVHRDEHGLPYGEALVRAVIASGVPDGVVEAFVHGNADMVKPLRRFLFREVGLDRARVSISGYWRTGLNEDGWQSSKKEFNAAMEAEDLT